MYVFIGIRALLMQALHYFINTLYLELFLIKNDGPDYPKYSSIHSLPLCYSDFTSSRPDYRHAYIKEKGKLANFPDHWKM